MSSAATPCPPDSLTTSVSVSHTVDAPDTLPIAVMSALDSSMIPSIAKIEVLISRNTSPMRGRRCLNSISSNPKLAALMTWKPIRARIITNSTSVIPTIASHKLKTLGLLAMSGVDFVKKSSAARNGTATAWMMLFSSPVTALIRTSIKPLLTLSGGIGCKLGSVDSVPAAGCP